MVAQGSAVTLLPALAVPTEARHARLAVRHFTRPAPYRTIALVWRPGSAIAPALEALAAAVREAWPAPA